MVACEPIKPDGRGVPSVWPANRAVRGVRGGKDSQVRFADRASEGDRICGTTDKDGYEVLLLPLACAGL